jgi:hypothetical protein
MPSIESPGDPASMRPLSQLEPKLANVERTGSSVTERAHAIASKQVDELTAAELAFCLRQRLALDHVFLSAVAILRVDPFIEAEGYPGDLLCSALDAAKDCLAPGCALHNELWDICADASASLATLQDHLVPSMERFRARVGKSA